MNSGTPLQTLYLFPGKSAYIAGGEILFLSLAKSFKHIFDVHILLQEGAAKALFLRENISGITLHFLNPNSRFSLDDSGILLCSAGGFTQICQSVLPSACKLVVWTLHTLELFSSTAPFTHSLPSIIGPKISTHYTRKMTQGTNFLEVIDKLYMQRGLYFMDYNTLQYAQYILNYTFNQPGAILPLPLPEKETISPPHYVPGSRLELAWLGRIESFKIPILCYLLSRLEQESTSFSVPIRMHIIGDGKSMEQIKTLVSTFKNFETVFHGFCSPETLDPLISSMHLIFAMGTSAVHSGLCGVPTVLLDYSDQPIPENGYQFSWLYDQVAGSLAQDINMPYFHQNVTFSLSEIVHLCATQFEDVAQKTRLYTQTHHCSGALSALKDALLDSSAPVSLAFDLRAKTVFYRIVFWALTSLREFLLNRKKVPTYSFLKESKLS
jgi:hypothetical protein